MALNEQNDFEGSVCPEGNEAKHSSREIGPS